MDDSPVKRLEDIPWYHNNLTRNGCEVLLLSNGTEGSYLIRPSQSIQGQYVVSVRSLNSVKHFPLSFDGKTFMFGVGVFSTFERLLDHFDNVPILAGETGLPITLKHPYPSAVTEPSLYDMISRHVVCGSVPASRTLSASDPDQGSISMTLSVASKEGFLTKQGGFHKNWKRRWFVTNRNTLQYFNERGDRKPLRVLNLQLAQETYANSSCERPHSFRLRERNARMDRLAEMENDTNEREKQKHNSVIEMTKLV